MNLPPVPLDCLSREGVLSQRKDCGSWSSGDIIPRCQGPSNSRSGRKRATFPELRNVQNGCFLMVYKPMWPQLIILCSGKCWEEARTKWAWGCLWGLPVSPGPVNPFPEQLPHLPCRAWLQFQKAEHSHHCNRCFLSSWPFPSPPFQRVGQPSEVWLSAIAGGLRPSSGQGSRKVWSTLKARRGNLMGRVLVWSWTGLCWNPCYATSQSIHLWKDTVLVSRSWSLLIALLYLAVFLDSCSSRAQAVSHGLASSPLPQVRPMTAAEISWGPALAVAVIPLNSSSALASLLSAQRVCVGPYRREEHSEGGASGGKDGPFFFQFYWEIIDIHQWLSLKDTAWWFDLHTYCEMISTIGSANILFSYKYNKNKGRKRRKTENWKFL